MLFVVGALLSAPIFRAKAYSPAAGDGDQRFCPGHRRDILRPDPHAGRGLRQYPGQPEAGELSDLVSQFEVNQESYQINYQNRPVRVTFLNYGDIFKWLKNTGSGIPAYMVVDMVTQEVTVQRIPEGIRYSPSEYFFRYVDRYLRFRYPTLMFTDINFEIDEEGRPWWVGSVVTKRIGLFGGEDVIGAVLLDAVTGESTYYDAADIPTWVDRVYTADLIMQQYNYYGRYLNGFINSLLSQTGLHRHHRRLQLHRPERRRLGVHRHHQRGGDQSNIGFILVNQRTKEAKYYAIAGATEYSAMDSAQGAVQQYSYQATFPLLLNIHGQPTYFMALKDASNLVKMYAMVNVQQYQIVSTGATVALAETNYLKNLAEASILPEDETGQPAEEPEAAEPVTGHRGHPGRSAPRWWRATPCIFSAWRAGRNGMSCPFPIA